jgi:hypothetical protein
MGNAYNGHNGRAAAWLHAVLVCVPESLLGALVGVLAVFGRGIA